MGPCCKASQTIHDQQLTLEVPPVNNRSGQPPQERHPCHLHTTSAHHNVSTSKGLGPWAAAATEATHNAGPGFGRTWTSFLDSYARTHTSFPTHKCQSGPRPCLTSGACRPHTLQLSTHTCAVPVSTHLHMVRLCSEPTATNSCTNRLQDKA